jgi:hypothetical protein
VEKGGREEVRGSIKSHAKPPRRQDERAKKMAAKDRKERKEMEKSKKQISQKITKDAKSELSLLNRLCASAPFVTFC